MKKTLYLSGMTVKPSDLMTTQSYLEQRVDINMNTIGNKGVVVGATTQDGFQLVSPYVWNDDTSLGVYGLIAYDESGRFIYVEPKISNRGTEDEEYIPTVANLIPDANGKLVESGGVGFEPNSTYIMVIRWAQEDDLGPESMRPHKKSGILQPTRIDTSFELYVRKSESAVLAGDVVLAYITTGEPHQSVGGGIVVNITSVDETKRDVFGLNIDLLRANMSDEANSAELGTNITFTDHINMIGGGKVTRSNPHGLSAADLNIDIAATGKHQQYLHSNGIKTNDVTTTTSALYPNKFVTSETSEEEVHIEPLSSDDSNYEVVIVNGNTITPADLGERYTLKLSSYATREKEGFYLLSVGADEKAIVLNGPFNSESDSGFVSLLTNVNYFPICSFHWGRPYYVYYTMVLEKVVGTDSEHPQEDSRKTLTNVPSTHVFIDSTTPSSTTILAADVVVREVDPQTGIYTGSIIREEEGGDQYWVVSRTQNLDEEDSYEIDPLSWRDRRVFNNTDFKDIRREDLAAIRDSAPFANNDVTIYYARVESENQLSYFPVGNKTLYLTIDGYNFEYTFTGVNELDKDQLLSQLNKEFSIQIPSEIKPVAYINHNKHLTIVASQSITVGNGTANSILGIEPMTDSGEDVKTLMYVGDMPSVQEMYYDDSGNLTQVYYVTEGNYLRSHLISYNGDFVSGVKETVEVY